MTRGRISSRASKSTNRVAIFCRIRDYDCAAYGAFLSEKTGIILAPHDDVHAHAVVYAAAQFGGEIRVLDAQQFTKLFNLKTRIGSRATSLELSGERVPEVVGADAISGIWYRRPFGYAHDVTGRDGGGSNRVAALAELERRAALLGSLDGFVRKAFNDIGRSRQANHKPLQLVRAKELGLTVPETLITNDPSAVREFVDLLSGRVVYKMFSSPPHGIYGTKFLEADDLARLGRLKICPAIFQEFVDGEFDVRATVVGDKVFSAKLCFDRSRDYVDTRFVDAEISSHQLPIDIEYALVELVRSFGLIYSAIDLRYSDDRGYVFFESNPEGQYLWTEIEAGLRISHEIAVQLVG